MFISLKTFCYKEALTQLIVSKLGEGSSKIVANLTSVMANLRVELEHPPQIIHHYTTNVNFPLTVKLLFSENSLLFYSEHKDVQDENIPYQKKLLQRHCHLTKLLQLQLWVIQVLLLEMASKTKKACGI